MRKHFILWAAAALLVASAAWAAEKTGTITSVDPSGNTFTIQTDDGERIVFRTDSSTRMMRDGDTVQLGDLQVGNRVEVTAPEAEGTAERTASEVELVGAGAGAGAAGEAGMRAGESGVSAGGEAGVRAGESGVSAGGEAGVRAGEGGVGAQAQADVDVDDDDRMARADRLPGTASPLPLIGLLGAAGVAAGLLVRRLRR